VANWNRPAALAFSGAACRRKSEICGRTGTNSIARVR
jgi:hypothetical protein